MIQKNALKKAIDIQILNDKKVQKNIDALTFKFFDRAKKDMLLELERHPITKDLESNVDSGLVTKGSLFGFLGFERGENPVEELRRFLTKSCKIRFFKQSAQKSTRTYKVSIPNKDELYSATPLRWAPGRSWVKAIEFGISGMGNYIEVDSSQSRSGEGIQSKTSNSGGRFRNSSYISSILINFQKKLLAKGINLS